MKKHLRWLLFGVFILGVLLRVVFVEDMEYKEDEEYNFTQSQLIGNSQPWPWYGIPSGVYLVNPGMSIWVFTILAKLFRIHQPTSLAHAVQGFALLGIALILPFAFYFVKEVKERNLWLWAYALALVNPFLILYQRKLWPEPFLPFFVMLTFMGWWKKEKWPWAILWGVSGAFLGQIHMSGFFFAFALFLWTVFFKAKEPGSAKRTCWSGWLIGSTLGALPLIPWAIYLFEHPVQEKISAGWNEISQFKYWAFWFTDPTGLTLGNPLGLLRGQSNWAQISDFIRYPLIGNTPTYAVGVFHALALVSALLVYGQGILNTLKNTLMKNILKNLGNPRNLKQPFGKPSHLIGVESSKTNFLVSSAFIGCGLLMTATGVIIRRYYMTITFPLEFIFLVALAKPESKLGRKLLITLFISELCISTGFVWYIHQNQGSVQGDYGEAYHLRVKSSTK